MLGSVIERDYDPLAYRTLCLSAYYRTPLNFAWDSLDSAETALQRLYTAAYKWGRPGAIDMAYRNRFLAEINDDLNLPRAMAVTWELVKSDLSSSTKKATLLEFDRVLYEF